MRILLLGKDGQVGWELQRSLAPLGGLVALGSTAADPCGDLADLAGITSTVATLEPDVIVNAGAYTAVDQAETDRERADLLNAAAPEALAQAATEHNALLVHYSTDYVFDGGGTRPWREDDPISPCNAYGAGKAAGEQALRDSGCQHLLFRTSWVYAARGQNFLRTMLRLACERDELRVIDDQHGVPTGAELIADVTAHAIVRALRQQELCGTYHLAPAGETSWHEYAVFAIEAARQLGLPVKVEKQAIEPISTCNYPTPARRPLNSRLDLTRLQQAFGLTLPDWQAGVARAVAELCAS